MAVILLALGAALLFGLGSVVQQRVASVAPPGKSLTLGLLLWLVRQPAWLAGLGTAVVGNLLSGAALGLGSVALVQPLLVTRLVFALPLSAVWARQRLVRRDWLGIVATVGGLAVFIIVGNPQEGTGNTGTPLWRWLVVAGAIGAITAALVLVSRRQGPARRAPLLGAGAGMLFALQSAFTHTAVGSFIDGGVGALLLNWTTYAVAVTAVLGTLLAQSAYEMAPLAASYPTLAAVEPLAAIGIAVGILGSTIALGAVPLAILIVALGIMTVGIYLLATSPLVGKQQTTMAQREDEEKLAALEAALGHDLDDLEAAVGWLENCWQPRRRRLRPSRVHHRIQCVDTVLPRIGTRLAALTELEDSQRAEFEARTNETDNDRGPEQALRRYHEDSLARGQRLRARAEGIQDRAEAQRALSRAHWDAE